MYVNNISKGDTTNKRKRKYVVSYCPQQKK